ncbi:putative sulfate exporter family transporter [Ammonifex thiophilus]|uniref:Putative sulfate exporter family transporter n=1 Tax=Ammonifex thiophilus TaxID=444093 RepID=A0A3D8P3X0_9THEO|nr:putative sulfate exporter family transporter [Ammonifex thiophilus]RDV82065.1 putative sulfate exporter family transporter [Ammonifex thiophilus]
MAQERNSGSPLLTTEDWWAVWLGLLIFFLALGKLYGVDLLGWVVKTDMWTDISKALSPVSKQFAQSMSGITSLILTYLFLLVITTVGAAAMRFNVGRFVVGFTIIFWLAYICWIIGHWGPIAAPTEADAQKLGMAKPVLRLTGEAGFIVALILGLIIGNFFRGFAQFLEEATRPEWYVKTAIVILGASIGIKACDALGLAGQILARGLCAIVEAYLIYWPLVYFIARRYFKFTPEWAAPLASGISICGVSAAIATGAAIRARPVVPIIVSSLVVIFAVVELILLPFLAQAFLYTQPMVAGAWMGLAVKTDGAAVASGAITAALIQAKAMNLLQVKWDKDFITMAAVTTKIFIDIFIGVWAFILALVWVYSIERKPGVQVQAIEIWHRFPKFVIGYFLTFLVMLLVGLGHLQDKAFINTAKAAMGEADSLRGIFFVLTFFTIGLMSNFRKLWEEGMGRLAAVYLICLFGFIVWIGLFISWLFFHGVYPPRLPM